MSHKAGPHELPAMKFENWKSQLKVVKSQNGDQKDKLTAFLRNGLPDANPILEKIEEFQSQFIQQDLVFDILWSDLLNLEKSKQEGLCSINRDGDESQHEMVLEKEIQLFGEHFLNLQTEFREFVRKCEFRRQARH